jgi:hypothetical protein
MPEIVRAAKSVPTTHWWKQRIKAKRTATRCLPLSVGHCVAMVHVMSVSYVCNRWYEMTMIVTLEWLINRQPAKILEYAVKNTLADMETYVRSFVPSFAPFACRSLIPFDDVVGN